MRFLHWLSWVGYQLDIGAFSNNYQGNLREPSEKVLGFATTESSYGAQLRNYAALIPSEKTQLEVTQVPFPSCGDDELVIRNHVVAVNPIDWKETQIQSGSFSVKYPIVLGEDVAGEVLEVGLNSKHNFHVGERVISHTMGLRNGPAYGGFQLYPVLKTATTSPIPDDISFTEAAVLPLSISTAAAGLFMNATLGLNYPKSDSSYSTPSANPEDIPTLLVWGGSSSVGSSVIQLASAAGYAVVTTASSSNHNYCKNLGAAHVLDYHNPKIIPNLINLLKGKTIVGSYDAIGSDTTVRQCASILTAFGGGKIASVGSAPSNLFPNVTIVRIAAGTIDTQEPSVAREIWGTYVPQALKSGKLVPSPKALVVGKGLEAIQKGLDRQKKGVSARKVVVSDLVESRF